MQGGENEMDWRLRGPRLQLGVGREQGESFVWTRKAQGGVLKAGRQPGVPQRNQEDPAAKSGRKERARWSEFKAQLRHLLPRENPVSNECVINRSFLIYSKRVLESLLLGIGMVLESEVCNAIHTCPPTQLRGQFSKENQDISPVELGEEVVQRKPRDAHQGS